MKLLKDQKGLTLIELLVVVTILGILAAAIFVALNPLRLFEDSRDVVRMQDVETILTAINLYQIYEGGNPSNVENMTSDVVYMITDVGVGSGCNDYNTYCDTNVVDSDDCVSLNALVTAGYLGEMPVSPEGDVEWDEDHTGYTIQKTAAGNIYIRACESEQNDEIYIVR